MIFRWENTYFFMHKNNYWKIEQNFFSPFHKKIDLYNALSIYVNKHLLPLCLCTSCDSYIFSIIISVFTKPWIYLISKPFMGIFDMLQNIDIPQVIAMYVYGGWIRLGEWYIMAIKTVSLFDRFITPVILYLYWYLPNNLAYSNSNKILNSWNIQER